MKYKMIALDIDGTLTNSQKVIPPSTKEALLEIQRLGVKIVLATGRPTAGCMKLAEELQLSEYGSYILSFNGARITNCQTNGIVYEKILPMEIIPKLYAFAQENHVGMITYEKETVITGTKIDEYMINEAGINGIPILSVDNFPEYVNFNVNKCLMTAHPAYLEQIEIKLNEQYGDLLSIYLSEPYFLEIMPQNVDKAMALSILLSENKLTKENLIACGDGFNDISMISFAGLGVAMENARPIVKNAADYLTSSNDNDGILHVINKYILDKG